MGLLLNSDRYYPRGLGLKDAVQAPLATDYHSAIVEKAREQGCRLERGDLTLHLAREFGFCYGVDRAVEYAYETCQKFPDRRIFLANEIIHNPFVNDRLRQMGVKLLPAGAAVAEKVREIRAEDVVLISAFGAPVEEMEALRKIGCVLVDTTCGSVMSVWKNVDRYAREGFTSIIHGKYDHEETKATCSRATQYPGGHYLVVRDLEEAGILCDYIVRGGDREAFLAKFKKACSEGFDPDRDLDRVGLANQTTMLSGESLRIAELVRLAMEKRHGAAETEKRFRTFDTICSATQDRQDAVRELLNLPLDLMIVIGGYNSSNTNHLAEIAIEKIPTFHVRDAGCLISDEKILHKPVGRSEEIAAADWLPKGKTAIGVTAGASTPNSKVGEVMERLMQIWEGRKLAPVR